MNKKRKQLFNPEHDFSAILGPESYNQILKDSPNACIIQDEMGMIIYENKKSIELLGGSLLGKQITDFVHPAFHNTILGRKQKVLKGGYVNFKEIKLIDCHKNVFDAEVAGTRIKVNDNYVIMTVYHDITERKAVQKALLEAELKYRYLVEESLVGVYLYLYPDDRFEYINPLLEKLLDYTLEELNKKGLMNIIVPEDRDLVQSNILKALNHQKTVSEKFGIVNKNGKIIDVEAKAAPINYHGSFALIGSVMDITENKKAEAQMNYMAYYDTLTGLPNRNMLNELFSKITESSENNQPMTLILLDLDRFKLINDTYGHRFGDLLLQQFATNIAKCINEKDAIVRYSGDEFVILLQAKNAEQAQDVAIKIMNSLAKPFIINGEETYISTSMGISEYPLNGQELETLLKNADSALNIIKQNGRNNYKVYTPNISQDLPRMVQLERDMRKAVERNELVLHYQPLVSLANGNVMGTEALIRWEHPKLGLISPLEFIPLAEENGMIVPIGHWVLETACNQTKKFQESGLPELYAAVNISRRQFKDLNFVQSVKTILAKTKLEPKYLELEITESLTQDIDQTLSIVNELKAIGVRIAIDDFGTGYSSLNVLKHCPIDTLKIDKSFIQDLYLDSKLVKIMIEMAHTFEFRVVAEGIENENQYNYLKNNHCEIGQGYLFSKPQPPTQDFITFLRQFSLKNYTQTI